MERNSFYVRVLLNEEGKERVSQHKIGQIWCKRNHLHVLCGQELQWWVLSESEWPSLVRECLSHSHTPSYKIMCRLTHMTLNKTSVITSHSEQEYIRQWRWNSCNAPKNMFKKNMTWNTCTRYHSATFASLYIDLSAHFALSYADFLCVTFIEYNLKSITQSKHFVRFRPQLVCVFVIITSENKPNQTSTCLPTYLPT